MRQHLKGAPALAILALVIAGGGALALRVVGPSTATESGDAPVESAIRVQGTGAATQIIVPRLVLAKGDLVVAPAAEASLAQTQTALATVLSLQPLVQQRQALATATAEARRAGAAALAARLEAKRLAQLQADGEIASAKALEAQQATATAEGAALANARAQIALQATGARQQFGPLLGGWLVRDAAPLQSLFAGHMLLVQLSGANLGAQPPERAELTLPDGSRVVVSIIGPAAQADPKFQAAGYYGLVPARAELAPGVSVPATLPAGPRLRGVAVPDAAIIRSNGRAIVYVERRPGVFVPTAIVTAARSGDGWLATAGLAPGARVVTHGAQLLFSQANQGTNVGGGE